MTASPAAIFFYSKLCWPRHRLGNVMIEDRREEKNYRNQKRLRPDKHRGLRQLLNRITERTADIHRGAAIMLSRIHAAQECDATEDASSTTVGLMHCILRILCRN